MDATSAAIAAEARDSPSSSSQKEPPEVAQALRDLKQRHYADWPDHALPALDGLTPGEATATAQGRNAVDVLKMEMENHGHRLSGPDVCDCSDLRRDLGLK